MIVENDGIYEQVKVAIKINDNFPIKELKININKIKNFEKYEYFECSVAKFKEIQSYFKNDELKVDIKGVITLFGKDLVVR